MLESIFFHLKGFSLKSFQCAFFGQKQEIEFAEEPVRRAFPDLSPPTNNYSSFHLFNLSILKIVFSFGDALNDGLNLFGLNLFLDLSKIIWSSAAYQSGQLIDLAGWPSRLV